VFRNRVGATTVQTLAAAPARLALAHNIGLAPMLSGLTARSDPFFLIPKRAQGQALLQKSVNYTSPPYLLVSAVNALAQLPAITINEHGTMANAGRNVLELPTALDNIQ